MGSSALENTLDKNGNPLANVDSDPANLLPFNTNHAVWTKFENSLTPGSFLCDRNIVAKTVTISKYTSIADTVLHYPSNTKIANYDTLYGINFNSYTKGRQFIIITDEDNVADASLPAHGASYPGTRVVIFSGYNKAGSRLDLNKLQVDMEWQGVENLLNEITIHGCLIKNITTRSWPISGSTGLFALSSQNCIFNENGRGDKSTSVGRGEGVNKRYFNKSGIKQSATWSLADIYRYVVEQYTKATSELLSLDNRYGVNLITYISTFIDCNYGNIDDTDLASITPYDFSLEGLGVLEAIIKIFEESKKYTLYKGYTPSGKVTITYRIKYADADNRNTGDNPMLINIGELGTPPNSTILFNTGQIALNRETKNVGRVVVIGDFLRLNTLCTTLAYADVNKQFSDNPDTYSAIGGVTNFSDRILLAITETKFAEKYEQVYIAVPINMMGLTVADLSASLNAYNDEADTVLIFDTLKALKINRFLDQGTLTEQGKNINDIAVYVGEPSEPESRGADETVLVWPTKLVDSDEFYFITPINNDTVGMDAKIDDSKHSGILISGRDLALSEETGWFPFREYVYNSDLEVQEISDGLQGTNPTNPIPLFVRANIQTDYRIKGVAQIATFDANVHETMIVYDNDFKLSMQYKDSIYAAGSFTNLDNGFINADDVEVLQKIQTKAESILSKQKVIQNSGVIELNGVQFYWKIGDWFNKLTGTNRDINTPAIVDRIIFNFQTKLTTLSLGS